MSCDTTTTDCPICMDAVQTNNNCVITECGHTFHTRCLLTNIVHNGYGCPYCRTEMVPEELLQDDDDEEEDDEMNQAFIVEDDEDEEGRTNWLTAEMNNGVTIRRRQMNRLRMYDRAHSTMRLMFARLEDENAEPEDVDFEDYNTIRSDNYSFDEEDDEDYETESDTGRVTESSDSDSESEDSGPALVDETAEEASRAFANHVPNVNQIAYSLERAEYTVADFLRALLRDEYPIYRSIVNNRRVDNTYNSIHRLIRRIISRYQERIYPTREDNADAAEDVPQAEEEQLTNENLGLIIRISQETRPILNLELD